MGEVVLLHLNISFSVRVIKTSENIKFKINPNGKHIRALHFNLRIIKINYLKLMKPFKLNRCDLYAERSSREIQ